MPCIDTNVYPGYFLERKGRNDSSEHAFNVFRRIIWYEFMVVVSDHFLFELRKHPDLKKAKILFVLVKK